MRLVLDNNLAPRLAVLLRDGGHDTNHVRDHGMQAATDEQVLDLARQEGRTLISADTDFGTLLARTGAAAPSIMLIRRSTARRPEQLAALLVANIDQVTEELIAGAIVVVTDVDLRVRRLPIPPWG
jgi:predicted nuclease of predicted toxin-antitoxin system